jgi:hypothetical protein
MPKSIRNIFVLLHFFLLSTLLYLSGCQSSLSRVQPEQFENPSFKMRASNLLFFRNTRRFYYEQLHDTLHPLEVFRWRQFTTKPTSPQIQPLLVINTLNNRAAMLLSLRLPNGAQLHDFRLQVSHPLTPLSADTLYCSKQDPPLKHHQLLARLYRAIEHQEQIDWLAEEQPASRIFIGEKERSDFRLQVRDYLRLTGAFD